MGTLIDVSMDDMKDHAGNNFCVLFFKILLKLHFKREFKTLFCKMMALFFYFRKRAGETSPSLSPASYASDTSIISCLAF